MIINKEMLDSVPGFLYEKNQETLQKYIGKLTGKVTVVDIGTLSGLSALTMASVSPKVYVLTVDPEPKCKVVNEHAKMLEMEDRVKFFNMTSTEFGKNHCPLQIDACFIDGRHENEGVQEDIQLIATKVRKGGYVMFHDKNLYSFGQIINSYVGSLYEFIEEEPQKIDSKTGRPYGSVYVAQRL